MKFSVAALVLFIIYIVGCAHALFFIEPIQYEIQDKYELTMEQLKLKCDSKDKRFYIEINADQETSSSVRALLEQELVKKAKDKKGELTKSDWDKWNKEVCIPNKTLKEISISAIDKIQQCVDQKDRLNDEKKGNAQRDLFKSFCGKVQVSAEFSYQAALNSQQSVDKFSLYFHLIMKFIFLQMFYFYVLR